jgi:hypothetical protein
MQNRARLTGRHSAHARKLRGSEALSSVQAVRRCLSEAPTWGTVPCRLTGPRASGPAAVTVAVYRPHTRPGSFFADVVHDRLSGPSAAVREDDRHAVWLRSRCDGDAVN